MKTFPNNPLINNGRRFKNCPNPRRRARAKALATLAERDTALASIELPTPPPMTAAELRQRIDRLNETLAAG